MTYSPSQIDSPTQFGVEIRPRHNGDFDRVYLACFGPSEVSIVSRDILIPFIEAYIESVGNPKTIANKLFPTSLPDLSTVGELTNGELTDDRQDTELTVSDEVNVSVVSEKTFNDYHIDRLYEVACADMPRDSDLWAVKVSQSMWESKIKYNYDREDIEEALLTLKKNIDDFNAARTTHAMQCEGRTFYHPGKNANIVDTVPCIHSEHVGNDSTVPLGSVGAEMAKFVDSIANEIQGNNDQTGDADAELVDIPPSSQDSVDRPGQWSVESIYQKHVDEDNSESISNAQLFLEYQGYQPCALPLSEWAGVTIIPNVASECIEIDTADLYLDTVPHDIYTAGQVSTSVQGVRSGEEYTSSYFKAINTTVKIPFDETLSIADVSSIGDTDCGKAVFNLLNKYEYLLEQREYNQCLHAAGLADNGSLRNQGVWSVRANFKSLSELLNTTVDNIYEQTRLSDEQARRLHGVISERNGARAQQPIGSSDLTREIRVHETSVQRGRKRIEQSTGSQEGDI